MTRVLIVDDKEENLYYLRALLTGAGYQVESASNGAEALAQARRSLPQVAIADLLMPVMDGYTLLRHWKADAQLQHVPFVVYTATYTEPEDEHLALSFGADAFMPKATDPDVFLARLRDVLAHAASSGPQPGQQAFEQDEEEPLRAYNGMLVRKLEKKSLQLEKSNHDLQVDIAERMRAEEALRLLSASVMQSTESVMITDAQLDLPGPTIVFVNPAFTRMTGYAADEVLGKTPRILQGPQTDRHVLERLRATLERGEVFEGQAIMYRKDGTSYWQEWQINPIRNPAGDITHFGAVQNDITERERAKQDLLAAERHQHELTQQLALQHARLVLAQRVAKIGSWETDLTTMTVVWSEQTHRIHGTDPASFQPTHAAFMQIVHPDDRARVDAAFLASQNERSTCSIEHRLLLADGSVKVVEECWQTFFDAAGKPLRSVGTCQDVTERNAVNVALVESEARFRQIAENIQAVFLLIEPDSSHVHYVSPAYAQLWGCSCASLYAQPQSWLESLHPLDRPDVTRVVHGHGAAGRSFTIESRIVQPDGEVRWIRLRGFPIRDAQGAPFRTACIAFDITESIRVQDELRESNRRFQDLLDNVQLISIMLDVDGRLTYCNDHFLRLTGFKREDIIGTSWFERFPPPDEARVRKARYQDCLDGDPSAAHLEREILTCTGERRLIRLNTTLLRSASGAVIGVASVGEDITAHRKAQTELAHSLTHDLTTGLPRFVLVEDYLHAAFVEAAGEESRVLVFYADMDRFHATNQTRGRAVGDHVLQVVAKRFREVIGDNGRVAHIAGDEFAIVLKDSGKLQDQVEFGEIIRSRIEEPIAYENRQIYVTCSVGVSCFPDNGSSPQELLRQAESAMLQAKDEGRNAVVAFSNEQKQELDDRLVLGVHMNDAVRDGEFLLHYQPRINGQDWRINGFEALLRWQSPEFGFLSPKRFLGVAEDIGLMVEIGRFVLDSACRQARAWLDAGADDFAISVNVSPVQMQRQNFVAEVRKALADNKLPASYIELELTESMIIGNIERVTSTMRALKALGVKLSLDDFGTGYSSLNYLRKFPIDTLKIDQSFVRDINVDPGAAGVCRAIITLGHQLGMTVLAEGVETAAQVGYLRRNDCDFFQGFYFCKPVSATQALEILRHRYLAHEGIEPQPAEQPTLLLVDDEENILNALTRMLRRDGYRILTATGAEEALDVLGRNDVQVVISDQRMPGTSGTELLSRVREMYPDTLRMVLSGYTDLAAVTAAINQGAIYKFLTKPWNDEELRLQIRDAFRLVRRPTEVKPGANVSV